MSKTARFLKILVEIVLAAALMLAGVVGIGFYLNHRAHEAASEFCAGIKTGADASEVVASASARGIRSRANPEKQVAFVFPGWVFNATLCVVSVEDGRVALKWLETQED